MKLAYLKITTWKNTSAIGAKHYYGSLNCEGVRTDLQFSLTAEQAEEINENDDVPGLYKAGSKSGRYDDEKVLIAQALSEYKVIFPQAGALIQGDYCCIDPRPVLDGPEEFKLKANKIVEECEANDWWEGDEKCMDSLSKQWDGLLKEFSLER